MTTKKILIMISISFCILFALSGVYAEDIDMNDTLVCDDNEIITDMVNENADDESPTASVDSDELLAATTIYFDASASSDGDGSQSKPYKTFKWSRISSQSTVYFANGEYTLDSSKYLFSSFQSLKFIGQSKENTIFKSNLNDVTEITVFENVKFTLSGMTLNGFHLYNYGTIDATNVIFQNEIRESSGGAINSYGYSNSVAELKLTNCQFKNNAVNSNGGAISASNSKLTIDGCVFYNSSSTNYGGAIYSSNSNVTIINSMFNYNTAVYGGAIYISKGKLILKKSQLISSTADYYGGAIDASSSNLEIESSNFTNSQSLGDAGGAIYSLSCYLNIYSSRFTNGKALFGGAICTLSSNSNIKSSTFLNNYASYYGGSIYDGYGNINITGNTFENSKAEASGGSIYSSLTYSLNLASNNFRNSTASVGNVVSIDPVMNNKFIASGNKYEGIAFSLENSEPVCFYNTNPYYEFGDDYSVPVFSYTPNYVTDLPSSYDSRDYGYMTPVKNQGMGGNCWAFASIATLEAALKKATGITYDFSEENLKNLMAYYSLYGRDIDVNGGGYMPMTMGYLMGWFGPIYDEMDEYTEFSALSANFTPLLHIQNIYDIPNDNRDLIKKAIVDYGAVVVGMPWISSGHAITLVGWDDNYNGYDFFNAYAKGAWIFKNSWGENWYDHGYYYVSFDRQIKYAFTFIFNDTVGYTDIYQYDLAGPTYYYKYYNFNAYKTRFTSRSNDILSAVAACFDTETDYTLVIYKNGIQVTTQNGHSLPGYMTIPLKNEISLNKGDEFVVEFQLNNGRIRTSHYSPNYDEDWPRINTVTFARGDSFARSNGNWFDLYGDDTSDHLTACIKAYTRPATLNDIEITMPNQFSQVKLNDEISVIFNVPDNIRGFVEFSINNKNYYAKIENSRACLNLSFDKEGTYNFRAQYKSNREISNVISFSFEVAKDVVIPNVKITAPNVVKYFGGTQKYVATVYDNDVLQKDVYVDIIIDDKTYTVKTNSYGQAIFDLNNLKIGSYIVKAKYNTVSYTSKVTIKSTISAGDVNGTYLNTKIGANFLDHDGNNLNNGQAIFEVGNKVFKANINNGYAVGDINLDVGDYIVKIKNPDTNEEIEVNLKIEKAEQEVTVLTKKEGNNVKLDIIIDKGVQNGRFYFYSSKITKSGDYTDGKISITLNNLTVGDHDYTLLIFSNENYNLKSFNFVWFTVVDENVELSADDLTCYYSQKKQFYVTLTYNGEPFKNQNINFEINGKKYEYSIYESIVNVYNLVTDENGKAFIKITEAPGIYPIVIRYGNITLTKKVTVKSTINCTSEDYDPSTSTLSATFMTSSGSPLENKKVTFIANGMTYSATTNNLGIATVKLNLNNGLNTVLITNPWSLENKSVNITVSKSKPTLTVLKEVNGNSVTLTARLSPSNVMGTVEFEVSNNVYPILISNREAKLTLNSLNVGSYRVYVKYLGSIDFDQTSVVIDFTINKITPALTLQAVMYNGKPAIKATLSETQASGTITFSYGSVVYTAPVLNGVSYLTLDEGDYSVSATYNGEGIFNSVSNSIHANTESRIISNNFNKNYLDEKTMPVRYVDFTGKGISSKQLKFVFYTKSNSYLSKVVKKTDTNGRVNLNVNYAPGTYYVEISDGSFTLDGYWIVVKKSISFIKASKKTFKLKQKTKKYTVSLETKYYYLVGQKVSLKIKGKTFTGKTNSKGKVTFKINNLKKKGTFKGTLKYKGSSLYNKCSKKVKIRVK